MSALEDRIREHFEQVAGRDLPPASISIVAATRRGRSLLRWRTARLAGPPALAGVSVLAVAVAGLLPIGTAHRPPAAPQTAAPRQFNPLVPYASFGWLPSGESVSGGYTDRVGAFLSAAEHRRPQWQLSVLAAGQCRRTLQTVISGGARHRVPYLNCGPGVADLRLRGAAPAVDGHEAFWVDSPYFAPGSQGPSQALVWEYAQGGWAQLAAVSTVKNPVQTTTRIADAVKLGRSASQPLYFKDQLTQVPANWQVSAAAFDRGHGLFVVNQYYVTNSNAAEAGVKTQFTPNLPTFDIYQSQPNGCYFYPGGSRGPRSVRRVINGYHVILSDFRAMKGAWDGLPYQEACAADADGLTVDITIYGRHPVIPAATVFKNIKLLGVGKPSLWTTKPFG